MASMIIYSQVMLIWLLQYESCQCPKSEALQVFWNQKSCNSKQRFGFGPIENQSASLCKLSDLVTFSRSI